MSMLCLIWEHELLSMISSEVRKCMLYFIYFIMNCAFFKRRMSIQIYNLFLTILKIKAAREYE